MERTKPRNNHTVSSTLIELGKANNRPYTWDSRKVINGHSIVVGGSGMGKTHFLRRFLSETMRQNPTAEFHVIDVHGDMSIPGADVVTFRESAGYGLNPLSISDDPDFGGVRRRVRSFIGMVNRTSRKLGPKQESVMQHLLYDLYNNRGFIADQPATWSETPQRQSPNMDNLMRYTNAKLRQMMIGASTKAVLSLDRLNKKYIALDRANLRAKGPEDVELAGLKQECKDLYAQYIDEIETGREIEDIIKYNSKDVVQSLYDRIGNIVGSGIFKSTPPPFAPNSKVRVYAIQALSADEQRMFVDVLAEELFFEARKNGIRPEPNQFIIIDEAHKFVSDDEDHILTLISREARKFGLGMILASQSLNHFSEDVLSNACTKILLGIDEIFHDATARRLKIDAARLANIVPHRTAIAQVKNKGTLDNKFVELTLPA